MLRFSLLSLDLVLDPFTSVEGEITVADERGKAIEAATAQMAKQFGKGSIMRLGSNKAIVPLS